MEVLMSPCESRFEIFQDPTNNWVVWDRELDDFAQLGTEQLFSLSETHARAACDLPNKFTSQRVA